MTPEKGKKTEYVLRLSATDRYRHLHIRVGNKIVFFRVQMETLIGQYWAPVARYDTAHGFAHRDVMDRSGETNKTPLFNQDLNDALTFAENDLKTNWISYKQRFLEG